MQRKTNKSISCNQLHVHLFNNQNKLITKPRCHIYQSMTLLLLLALLRLHLFFHYSLICYYLKNSCKGEILVQYNKYYKNICDVM